MKKLALALALMTLSAAQAQQTTTGAPQTQTQDDPDRQEIVQAIQQDYAEISGVLAAGDKLIKQKQFQQAMTTYAAGTYIDQKAAYYKTEIAKRGLTGNIILGGKSMTLVQAADLLAELADNANTKMLASNSAATDEDDAIDAAMDKAAAATLKGDRLTAYKQIGIPFSLSPAAYMGPDVKKTAASMQKAKVWEYHNSWSDYGGFTCDIKLTFNGNKLAARSISTTSDISEAKAFCRNKYTY